MKYFRLSAFSDEYHENLLEQIEGLHQTGISMMEVRFVDGKNVAELSGEETQRLAAQLRENHIHASAIASPIGKIALDDDFEKETDRLYRCLGIAEKLNTNKLRLFSFYPPAEGFDPDSENLVLQKLERIVAICREKKVLPCLENEHGVYGESPETLWRILQYFRGDMGCVFDMGNFVLDGYDPENAYQLLSKDITYFHIKDGFYKGKIVPPGMGDAKIAEILGKHFREQASVKGDIVISLEPHLMDFKGLSTLTEAKHMQGLTYNSSQEAFVDAAGRLQEIIGGIA